ncbi:heme/hemin ABC transporter substrate-binding protein [Phyllobacterium sp. 22552]|uniref:heme/hemin ABC transporter substrate-binding protein n=1 Tax=Phyllobacterium sp. 22552 TaxID=3453941 RepID=UPI003F82C936
MTKSVKLAALAGIFGVLALSSHAFAKEVSGSLPDTSRVVSIGGSITEIIFALGEQGRLVGRDTTSVYPKEAFALPDVGYMRALSAEGVLSINPTAIIAVEGSGPEQAVDLLKKASVPFVFVPENYTATSVSEKIRIVGKALSVEDKAKKLADDVEADLAAARAETKDIKTRKRVLFVLSIQGGKILAAGDHSAANGIIKLAGADNAVEGFTGYKALSDESILLAKPDVILVMDRGDNHATVDKELLANKAIASTPAGENKAIIRMGGQYLLGFGPRTASAVRDLSKRLYGDAVSQ